MSSPVEQGAPLPPAVSGVDALRIVIADDHALFRGGLSLLIKMMDEPVEILEANDLAQVDDLLEGETAVDLLLLDLMMPGMNGIRGVETIRRNWPDVPIVVVSVRDDIGAIREALQAGAVGYIPKTSSPEVTTNAIRFILSGGVYIPPEVLVGGNSESGAADAGEPIPAPPSDAQSLGLTGRQLEVLSLLALGRSNRDIGAELGISAGTVKMHVSRIFKVLDVSNRTEAAARLAELATP